ncbi:MAG: phosphonate C-P lyase system protein PhnH [Nitrospirae bacterium]|nr:phosphonate C-P lyase system protein PhnH [Nitrospirota bacterium]
MDNTYLLAQITYRIILQSMGHPGKIYQLPGGWVNGQGAGDTRTGCGKADGLMSVLLTLLDHEVTFFLLGSSANCFEDKIFELTRSTVSDIVSADFIIVPEGKSGGEVLKARRGSLDYPDAGATVLYIIDSLVDRSNGKGRILLKGPGIKDGLEISVSGPMKDEFLCIKEANAEFPLGIDCIFIDKFDRIMCIPRSTMIEVN